ncbi:hypothetical protein ACFT30_09440 [Microbacterium ureisolvens]|uniref:hypothetical protein n=1 Tax=Microbacterium ureisolvens TaxID=2781186 RepID=UPI0036392F2A
MDHEGIHQLVLTPLAERSWRLCDRNVERGDAASLVAYVELLETGTYEAVWVSLGLGAARYASLEAVFLAAMELLDHPCGTRSFKPAPIPHRPPARS